MNLKSSKAAPGPQPGTITITHGQTMRHSANYNSAEASYGATMVIAADIKDKATVDKAFKLLENTVERLLIAKGAEQKDYLTRLS